MTNTKQRSVTTEERELIVAALKTVGTDKAEALAERLADAVLADVNGLWLHHGRALHDDDDTCKVIEHTDEVCSSDIMRAICLDTTVEALQVEPDSDWDDDDDSDTAKFISLDETPLIDLINEPVTASNYN